MIAAPVALSNGTFVSDFAKNGVNGVPFLMNIGDAENYCAQISGHLPSAREAALIAMSQGSKGISPDHEGPLASSERRIYTMDLNHAGQTSDTFIYDIQGFKPQVADVTDFQNGYEYNKTGQLENQRPVSHAEIWTSTVSRQSSYSSELERWSLNLSNGELQTGVISKYESDFVKCIISHP
jgi:hypothetical protein